MVNAGCGGFSTESLLSSLRGKQEVLQPRIWKWPMFLETSKFPFPHLKFLK